MTLQDSNSTVMDDIHWFGNFTFWIVGCIVLVCGHPAGCRSGQVQCQSQPDPFESVPSYHDLKWSATIVPILILLVLAVPSFRLLYKELEIPEADLTVKVTGYQWYWGYEYPDTPDVSFDSLMLNDEERAAKGTNEPRLLAVDNEMVVPVGKVVRVQVTSADVIHSYAMPSMGVKVDAIPGRLNESWFKADREGIYYGQCSELCGNGPCLHAFGYSRCQSGQV